VVLLIQITEQGGFLNKENITLGDISFISVGFVIARASKTSLQTSDSLRYKYLTLSSVDGDMKIDTSKLREFEADRYVDERFLTRRGDIIIGLSSPHSLVCIDADYEGIVIPSQFAVIRVFEGVLPEYLVVYLNSNDVKNKITQMSNGVYVKIINAAMLQGLNVVVPTLDVQRKLSKLGELFNEENKLNMMFAGLIKKRNAYYLDKFMERLYITQEKRK